MLKTIMLRKRLQVLQAEETDLRSKQAGFKKREDEIAAQVEAKVRENLQKAGTAGKAPAKAAEKPVAVSADDFNDED